MNDDRLYTQWINQRRKTSIPDGFAKQVMKSVPREVPDGWLLPLFKSTGIAQRVLRWVAAASMVLLGIFRLLFVTANLLIGGTL